MDLEIKKCLDRAFRDMDQRTAHKLDILPLPVALAMAIRMGKLLLEQDEWNSLKKKMKITKWERFIDRLRSFYSNLPKMRAYLGSKSKKS